MENVSKYCYDNGVLINKYEIKNRDVLQVKEIEATTKRMNELKYMEYRFSLLDKNNPNHFDISGLKFCLKSQSQAQSIINILEEKNSINDCTDTCFSEKGKLILEKNICVDDCSKDDEYIYEYQKRCYNSCLCFLYLWLRFARILCEDGCACGSRTELPLG